VAFVYYILRDATIAEFWSITGGGAVIGGLTMYLWYDCAGPGLKPIPRFADFIMQHIGLTILVSGVVGGVIGTAVGINVPPVSRSVAWAILACFILNLPLSFLFKPSASDRREGELSGALRQIEHEIKEGHLRPDQESRVIEWLQGLKEADFPDIRQRATKCLDQLAGK
jgi:hypothetical protein